MQRRKTNRATSPRALDADAAGDKLWARIKRAMVDHQKTGPDVMSLGDRKAGEHKKGERGVVRVHPYLSH